MTEGSRYPTLAKNVEERAGDRQRQNQGPHEVHDFKPPKGRYDVREPKGPGNFILNNPRLQGTSRFEGARREAVNGYLAEKNHFRKESTWGKILRFPKSTRKFPRRSLRSEPHFLLLAFPEATGSNW